MSSEHPGRVLRSEPDVTPRASDPPCRGSRAITTATTVRCYALPTHEDRQAAIERLSVDE